MKKVYFIIILSAVTALSAFTFSHKKADNDYAKTYFEKKKIFDDQLTALINSIENSDLKSSQDINKISAQIRLAREKLKVMDFWFRYFDPFSYKKINGPLPVEWEFEVLEPPRKIEGAGLTLAELYLAEDNIVKDTLLDLISSAVRASEIFNANIFKDELKTYHHFFLCNRLYLLNLAAIYTTGFECPDTSGIIPELRKMLSGIGDIYASFNAGFPDTKLSGDYLTIYNDAVSFVNQEPSDFTEFDHFTFIKDYINPLFKINQEFINEYKVASRSYSDRTLNNNSSSIFSKDLFMLQNSKGIFKGIKEDSVLAEIERIGKLLFYDPILSGNNKRSCFSCHKSNMHFTDTAVATALQFDNVNFLERNTPSLINVVYNQLVMLDGKHLTLQLQAKEVITNPIELGSKEKELIKKVLSCREYSEAFSNFLKYSPQEKNITIDHIVSAVAFYFSKFSDYSSPFDEAMNNNRAVDEHVKNGFNLFMSKAKCGTCHFVPQFNGVKPPYLSSEFEVVGTPEDSAFTALSSDPGRYKQNPVKETMNAFRTGSIRNAEHTKPYMHNGVFFSLEQVIDFYNAGGGAGRNLTVTNQTLSSDSLHLTDSEKNDLILFIRSLSEDIMFEPLPEYLPRSDDEVLNERIIGGEY